MTKNILAIVALALSLLSPSLAAAKVEHCRHIGNRAERDACYKRQDEARLAAQKAAETKARPSATITSEQIRLENERVGSKLKGICRGC